MGKHVMNRKCSGGLFVLIAAFFAIILSFIACNVHPYFSVSDNAEKKDDLNIVKNASEVINNIAADALSDIVYVKKTYSIDEAADTAPKPDSSCYGETYDTAVIREIIDSAAELLDGQDTIWNEDIEFYTGKPFRYYYDETILAISWKQIVNGCFCTYAEVKIADGSQIRRKLAEDTYGSSLKYYQSTLADEANAVISMDGDFYTYRYGGITVYKREIYRYNPEKIDDCFVTADGDLLLIYADRFSCEDEAAQYIKDNDVVFSLAFGPILVDDGQVRHVESYPIGEVKLPYSRAAIGQYDKLHYVMLTIGHEGGCTPCTTNEAADIIAKTGVKTAYTVDGGQTAEIYMNGEILNFVDFNAERYVSDIIYFATAIPESESNHE